VHAAAAEDALTSTAPSPEPTGDAYASGEYRAHLATVLARRALTTAFDRAG
jgi:CO/xanthine dehydrogenase FAD-binding subunit